MGVGAQNNLGGHESFARKMIWKLPDKSIFFLSELRWSPKKKVFTQIETVFLSSARNILVGKFAQNFDAKLPKQYKIARKFDAKSPKIYEIAQNFVRNPPYTNRGGQCPPAPPPPTPMNASIPQAS